MNNNLALEWYRKHVYNLFVLVWRYINMKKYETIEVEIVKFDAEDVITSSNDLDPDMS